MSYWNKEQLNFKLDIIQLLVSQATSEITAKSMIQWEW